MPNSDLFDRAEGYGHALGTQDSKDDGDWDTAVTVMADKSEALAPRLARLVDTKDADDRKVGVAVQHPDLYDRTDGYDHTDATGAAYPDDDMTALVADNDVALTESGTNTALTNASTEANTNRTADAPDSTERAAIGFADRTSGWGHSAAIAPADLKDA